MLSRKRVYVRLMKTKIFLIALFVVANSISAKMERRSLPGHQNGNVIEQTTSDNPSRLGNSSTVVSDPIETSKKIDKPKKGEKKPRRHIFLKAVGGVVFVFGIVITILWGNSDNGNGF